MLIWVFSFTFSLQAPLVSFGSGLELMGLHPWTSSSQCWSSWWLWLPSYWTHSVHGHGEVSWCSRPLNFRIYNTQINFDRVSWFLARMDGWMELVIILPSQVLLMIIIKTLSTIGSESKYFVLMFTFILSPSINTLTTLPATKQCQW